MQRLHNASQAVDWLRTKLHGELCMDSRQVRPGDGFIAWPGHATDARRHVRAALESAAAEREPLRATRAELAIG